MTILATVVGYATLTGIAILFVWVIGEIILNIFWGIVGAYRLKKYVTPKPGMAITHWAAIKFGLTNCFGGNRYDGNVGTFWIVDSQEIPLDGRDKIHDRWPG